MNVRLELTGQTFGSWFVIGFSHKTKRGQIYWLCRDTVTGEKRPVRTFHLTSGVSQSAGHRHRAAVTTHGMTGTPTFKSWESMKQRCLNPNAPDYPRYGGRGIEVHPPWINSFETFLADMGVRPEGTTLDRRDVNGNYTPRNCRWATPSRQQRNRRDTYTATHDGRTQSVADWAGETGIPAKIIRERIKAGWSPAVAISKPSRKKPKR